MTAAALLDRLESVKQTSADRWIARCPAHDDRRPSLNIRETSQGTVLIRCFSGCSADEIVRAVGLEMSDLFPARPNADHHRRPERAWRADDLLRTCANEALLVALAAHDLAMGVVVDTDRLTAAAGRLMAAVSLVEAKS